MQEHSQLHPLIQTIKTHMESEEYANVPGGVKQIVSLKIQILKNVQIAFANISTESPAIIPVYLEYTEHELNSILSFIKLHIGQCKHFTASENKK